MVKGLEGVSFYRVWRLGALGIDGLGFIYIYGLGFRAERMWGKVQSLGGFGPRFGLQGVWLWALTI